MHIIVLIAGVLDPKKTIPTPPSGQWEDLLISPTTPFKLSPFDEAALEIALKLRDKDPTTTITALVTMAADDINFLRSVAAFRLDEVHGLSICAAKKVDPNLLTQEIEKTLSELKNADLVLIGREHGDLDDGVLPAYLAAKLNLPFISHALTATMQNSELVFYKTHSTFDEEIRTNSIVLASISNDKANKLRHPLMKNVAMAKQMKFNIFSYKKNTENPRIQLNIQAVNESNIEKEPCQMLQGTLNEQVTSLINYLNREHRLEEV